MVSIIGVIQMIILQRSSILFDFDMIQKVLVLSIISMNKFKLPSFK